MTDAEFKLSDSYARSLAEPNVIFRAIVGSTVHGLSIEGTDDRDEMGVCVESPEHFFGLRQRFEQWTARTQPDGARSGPGDLDLVIYSLAKWVRLALGGNPTILTVLFVPDSAVLVTTEIWEALRRLTPAFIGDNIFGPYLGYMQQQRHRLTNKVKMPNRPELVERYGFDTKYAGHLIRLGYQGIELATTGTLMLPMPEASRLRVLAVRRGEVTESEVLAEAEHLERDLLRLKKTSTLGPPDRNRIERFVIGCYRDRVVWRG